MKFEPNLKVGYIYYIEGYTAPKVFNGLYFECLLTTQKISANCKVKATDTHIKDWDSKIYQPERFNQL